MTDHYVIRTRDGWRPLLAPMAAAPQPDPNWGRFPGAANYDAMFRASDGSDMRVTGDWYHLREAV